MSKKWFSNGDIRYSCNNDQKVLQQGQNEVLKPGIVFDYIEKNGDDLEVHFCNRECMDAFFNKLQQKENKNEVVG